MFSFGSDGVEAADVGIDDGEKPTSSLSSSSSDDELSPKSGRRLLPAPAFTRITYVHIHQCHDFSVKLQCCCCLY
jgi:cysteamine dioxygenase